MYHSFEMGKESTQNYFIKSLQQILGPQTILISSQKNNYEIDDARKSSSSSCIDSVVSVKTIGKSMHIQMKLLTSKKLDSKPTSDGTQQLFANLINTNLITDNCSVNWQTKQKNFAAKKIISFQLINELQRQNFKRLLIDSLKTLKKLLHKCTTNINVNQEQAVDHIILAQQKKNQQTCSRKTDTLQNLIFQFQQRRKTRPKFTNINFYSLKTKTLEEYEKFIKQKKSMSLNENKRQNQVNSQNLSAKSKQIFQKLVKQFNEKQNKTLFQNSIKTKHILSCIRVYEEKKVVEQCIEGSFSTMEAVDAKFRIIFSVNSNTNQQIINNVQIQEQPNKEKSSVLIKKVKDSQEFRKSYYENAGQEDRSKIQKQLLQRKIIFENQIQILLFLRQPYHESICQFYVQQFEKQENIQTLYSKKYPHKSCTKVVLQQNKSELRTLCKVLKLLTEIAEGIYFLSRYKIIHRDLKPANVVLDASGKAKIIDFGSSSPVYGAVCPMKEEYYKTLRSTVGYFSSYLSLNKLIKDKYERKQYERHQHFDVYSLGAMAKQFFDTIYIPNEEKLQDYMNYFVIKATDRHPDDRISPLQASLFLRYLASYAIEIHKTKN